MYVHADKLPAAAGRYLPQASMPPDRWLVAPLMRLLPAKTRARIEAANSITDVVHPLDRQAGVPGPAGLGLGSHARAHAGSRRLPASQRRGPARRGRRPDRGSELGRRGAVWPPARGRPTVVHNLGLAGGHAVDRGFGGAGAPSAAAGARRTPDRRDGRGPAHPGPGSPRIHRRRRAQGFQPPRYGGRGRDRRHGGTTRPREPGRWIDWLLARRRDRVPRALHADL
jgi:hypothetical protein